MNWDTRVLWRRAAAHTVDGALPVVLALVIAKAAGDDAGGVFFALFVGINLLEFIVLQGATGFTPGKWLFGIRVVDAQGLPPGILGAIKRTIPLLFEWTTLIALIAIYTHPHGQRFGDRWAGTYVIRSPRTATGEAVPA
ncbi:MAG: RDD family protein [Actinomycetota bacterium]|nr:RDD family protein [Actinomycetota bacterium]